MNRQKQHVVGIGLIVLLAALGCERAGAPDPPLSDAVLTKSVEYRKKLTAGATEEGATDEATASTTATGWGTLSGKFVLAEGDAIPKYNPLNINKDPAVCGPGANSPIGRDVRIDEATRGIANVLVFARKVGREHESVQSSEIIPFDQKQCIFLSHVQPIRVGQTLNILNSDPVAHNTSISRSGMKGASFNQTIPSGGSLPFQPTAEENQPVDVSCSIHPWMKAYLMPRANGYFAVTDGEGKFEIANLPAGEDLEFQVWHERGAGSGGALVAKAPTVSKWGGNGRFKLKLAEDETTTVDATVPAGSFN